MQICNKFALNLVLIKQKKYAESAPFNGAIWDDFREILAPKHKKAPYLAPY